MTFSTIRAVAVLLLATSTALAATPTIGLGSATLIGREASVPQASPANAYLGIPFAEPPKRFLPPEPLMNFTGIYNATEYKAACVQQGSGNFYQASLLGGLQLTSLQRYLPGTRTLHSTPYLATTPHKARIAST